MTDPIAEIATDTAAAPVPVDAEELLRQIQQLQQQMAALRASQPIPADPVEAAIQNLKDHVDARAAASPGFDMSSLRKLVNDAHARVAKGVKLVEADATRIRLAVEDVMHGRLTHELDYFAQLGRDLHKSVIDTAAA